MPDAFHNTGWNSFGPELPAAKMSINERERSADNRNGCDGDAERYPDRLQDVDRTVERHRADEYSETGVEQPAPEPTGIATHDDPRRISRRMPCSNPYR